MSDRDGDIAIFELLPEKQLVAEVAMNSAVDTSPVVANDTLFIANSNRIFVIKEELKRSAEEGQARAHIRKCCTEERQGFYRVNRRGS